MLTTNRVIFTITAAEAYAYQPSTGDRIWATQLGNGHVVMYFQMEGSLLRVYYGDRIIEISPETGQILRDQAGDDIEWIENNVEIHSSSPGQGTGMIGVDHITRKTLWSNEEQAFIKIKQFPIQSTDHTLFVLTSNRGICSLDIISGNYVWCRPEEYISNMSLNHSENTGYVINSDFSLVRIDLLTGEILGKIQFLPNELPSDMQNRGFEYSVTATRDDVIVSFGDSNQTFGLKLLK